MELAPRTHNASKVELEDVINSMPDNVVTNILDRLPIQCAVRTGILSRKWRYKWTLLTHIEFDADFYVYLLRRKIKNWFDVRNIISRLLLHLKGPITKFILNIPVDMVPDVEDINNWVMFLSRKGMKVFDLENMRVTPLELSTHIFSCVDLEYLLLKNCSLHSPPTFCGLPNLLYLYVYKVECEHLGETITKSPLLEVLSFQTCIGRIKLVDIVKLKNLKQLLLPLHLLDHTMITSSLIVDLGSYFPNLEELILDFRQVRVNFFFKTQLTRKLDPFDPALRLWVSIARYTSNVVLNDAVPPPAIFSSKLNSIILGQTQLQDVVIQSFQGLENELLLIKILLEGSPLLKKIAIHPLLKVFGENNERFKVATKLLTFERASPKAKVEIDW
ncbi:F-box protein At1g80960-like [Rutidosis leptorrhynchoides]|uniref:F-box protein At1g80960-like n=1 Tax=Rutidosis leptorrhynchoides TaxID=125765 RepID=UPI003A996C70